MLLTVGVSVAMLRVRAVVDLCPSERGSIEVWTESFGLFAGGCVEGITDRLIAAAAAAGTPASGAAAVAVAGGAGGAGGNGDVKSEVWAGRVAQVRS